MDVVHYPKKLKVKLDLSTTGTDATSTLKYVGYWLVEAEYILVVKDEYSGRGFVNLCEIYHISIKHLIRLWMILF